MATSSTALIRATARNSFWMQFNQYANLFDGLYFDTDSDADQNTYPWLAYSPAVHEMAGDRHPETVPEISWTIKNKLWEASVPISYRLWKYEKLPAIAALTGKMGAKARAHRDKLFSALLEAGTTSTCYDGQYFFDTDHADPGASYTTNQSNALTANIGTPSVPTDTEHLAAIQAILAKFWTYKDGAGDAVYTFTPKVHLMVPSCHESVTNSLAVSDTYGTGLTNPVKGLFTWSVNSLLSNTDRFFAFITNTVWKPFIFQTATPIQIEDDFDSADYFKTKDRTVGSFGDYNAGYGEWRTCIQYIYT